MGVGYDPDEIIFRVAIFDRRLLYDTTPSVSDLTNWDGASLHLDLKEAPSDSLGLDLYRLEGQLNW